MIQYKDNAIILIKNERVSSFSQVIKYGDKYLVNYIISKSGSIQDKFNGKILFYYVMKKIFNEKEEKIKEIKTKNSIALYIINNGVIE